VGEDPKPELVFVTILLPVLEEQTVPAQGQNFRLAIPRHVEELSVSICSKSPPHTSCPPPNILGKR